MRLACILSLFSLRFMLVGESEALYGICTVVFPTFRAWFGTDDPQCTSKLWLLWNRRGHATYYKLKLPVQQNWNEIFLKIETNSNSNGACQLHQQHTVIHLLHNTSCWQLVLGTLRSQGLRTDYTAHSAVEASAAKECQPCDGSGSELNQSSQTRDKCKKYIYITKLATVYSTALIVDTSCYYTITMTMTMLIK